MGQYPSGLTHLPLTRKYGRTHPFPEHIKPCKIVLFLDDENLTIRRKNQLTNQDALSHAEFELDVFV